MPESNDEPKIVQVEYAFTMEQYRSIVLASLDAKADVWELEAQTESLRGAANQSMMGALRWGANQLREIGKALKEIPLVVLVDVPVFEGPPAEESDGSSEVVFVGPPEQSGEPTPESPDQTFEERIAGLSAEEQASATEAVLGVEEAPKPKRGRPKSDLTSAPAQSENGTGAE